MNYAAKRGGLLVSQKAGLLNRRDVNRSHKGMAQKLRDVDHYLST